MDVDAWQGTAVAAACVLAVLGMSVGEARARDRRVMSARPADFVAAPPLATPSPPPRSPTAREIEDAKSFGMRSIGNEPESPSTRGARKGAPTVRSPALPVVTRLPPEVVQRIVRQNFGRFRLCYEAGLRTNPALAGSVVIKFVIGRDGAVTQASDGGSTLPDPTVVGCTVRSFVSMSFPQPDNGIATVVYRLELAP